MSMKNSNNSTWDRTSDLPICSTAHIHALYRDIQCVLRGIVTILGGGSMDYSE